jgi:hypothetical protein
MASPEKRRGEDNGHDNHLSVSPPTCGAEEREPLEQAGYPHV